MWTETSRGGINPQDRYYNSVDLRGTEQRVGYAKLTAATT